LRFVLSEEVAMKIAFGFAAVAACVMIVSPRVSAATAAPADLVQQVQAADLLADLMTYTVDRADVRLKNAQDFLASIGKTQAYEQAHPNPALPRPLNYMLLFRGSLAFVEGEGQKYADQSVNDQGTPQLYQELTAAQYYNMHEFLHFNQQRQEFDSIRAYLKSIGQYDKYLASANGQETESSPPSTQPTPATPEAVAQRMGKLIDFIYDSAQTQAQAQGTSRADFEKHWPEQVKEYRESVMARIEGAQPPQSAFGKSEIAGTAPPPTSAPAAMAGATLPPQTVYVIPQQPNLGANHPLPPTVRSPYSNSVYRSRDLSLWNMWDYNPRY
jgi:hypothetical protein